MRDTEDICDDVLIALRQITRAIDIHSRRLMQTSGLTGPQLLVLQILNRKGEAMPIVELADSISLSQGTMTSILERLLKKALIEKNRGLVDKRKTYISLTAAGKEAIKLAPTPLQEHFVSTFKQLQNWEQTLILSSLQRVGQMMNADNIDASPILDNQPVLATAEPEPVANGAPADKP